MVLEGETICQKESIFRSMIFSMSFSKMIHQWQGFLQLLSNQKFGKFNYRGHGKKILLEGQRYFVSRLDWGFGNCKMFPQRWLSLAMLKAISVKKL